MRQETITDELKQRGERLKEVRTKTGLNQTDFAATIGTTISNYNRNEKGLSKMRDATLRKVSEEYEVSFEWLKSGIGSQIKEESELLTGLSQVHIIEKTALVSINNKLKHSTQMSKIIYLPGLDPEKTYYGIQIDNRNMEPQLPEGSIAIIEHIKPEEFEGDKIYLLIINQTPIIRKVNLIIGGEDTGKLRLSQEDKEIKDEIIEKEAIELWYKASHFIGKL